MDRDPRECDGYVMSVVRIKSRQLVGRYGFTSSDRADIEQDLLVNLVVGLRQFDPARAQRSTFIAAIIRRSVASIIRHRVQQRRDYRRCRESLDRVVGEDGTTVLESVQSGADDGAVLDLRLDLADAMEMLPEGLRELASSVGKETVAAIGRRTGRSRESIRHALRGVRRHLANRGMEAYMPSNHSAATAHR